MSILVEHENYSYHKQEQGSSRAIVFIHGVAAGAWCFDSMAEYFFDRDFDTYAIDLPGHGTRAGRDKSLSLPKYRDVARELIDIVSATHEEVFLVGHSMGGHIAQTVGAELKIAGLVLLAPAPCRGVKFEGLNVDTLIDTFSGSIAAYRKEGGSLLQHHIAQFFIDKNDPIIESWTAQRVFEPLNVIAKLRIAPSGMNLPTTRRAFVGIPTSDIVISPITMRATADHIKALGINVDTQELPLSHMLIAERGWEQTAFAVLDWINK